MDVFFINLAEEAGRRGFVESNFAANNSHAWRLHRIEAVTAAQAAAVTGKIRAAEKACFLSHAEALRQAQHLGGHAFIAEDDIRFGRASEQSVEAVIAALPEDGWDLLYTDILVPEAEEMIRCFRAWRRTAGKPTALNLKGARFVGATGYVVNAKAKDKLAGLLASEGGLDLPYDLFLARLVQSDRLRALVILPFATTVSEFGARSRIQPGGTETTEFIWTAFRHLLWAEDEQAAAEAHRIAAGVTDGATTAFAGILAGMLNPDFKPKRG